MSASANLKVMTFNIRFDNPEDGLHAWPFRRELVVETVLREGPDLLATQEGMPAQLEHLSRDLRGYAACFPPRGQDPDPRVQYPTIFFRSALLAQETCGEFWLSETPEVHRSKSWGAAFPRVFTFGRFRHRFTGKGLWFANTHLDHVSAEARVQGVGLILRWVRRRRLPVILAGDFNDVPDGRIHRLLTDRPGPLRDSWRAVGGPPEEEVSTAHHFTGKGEGGRIDWILVSPGVEVEEARILDRFEGDAFPSDHFPYLARIRISSR